MGKYKRKSRQERILEIQNSAIKVFIKKGYRSATMEDIISQTTLSKGGFYRYYQSKQSILIDIMNLANDYRINKFKDIYQKMTDKTSITDLIVSLTLNKLFDEVPLIRLYGMFISEIIYDQNIKEVFYQIEKESFEKAINLIKEDYPKVEINKIQKQYLFFSRIINGMLFIDEIFKEQNILHKNKDKTERLIRTMID